MGFTAAADRVRHSRGGTPALPRASPQKDELGERISR